jgi:maltose O-acetyltransferase
MSRSEREKMLDDDPYIALDPELQQMYRRAQNLLDTFNRSAYADIDTRREVIKTLFGAIGSNFKIERPFYCDYGCHIYAQDNLYINFDCTILDGNKVYLGNNVLLAPKVQIYTAYHPIDPQLRNAGVEMAASISIGDNVWIGGGAIICPGVSIGENTTIGAGSVVTKAIPANVVAVGNPCRVIRRI